LNDIVIVRKGPDQGLYLNGVKVPGVFRVEPDHYGAGDVPTARIVLSFRSYAFADEAPESLLK
jgi:hypothetical protein